jgi:UDP-N-acetylmuramate--alanine ligase
MCRKQDILACVREKDFDVLVTLGAGDIENYAKEIADILNN